MAEAIAICGKAEKKSKCHLSQAYHKHKAQGGTYLQVEEWGANEYVQ